jgi:hypothetical protein
LFSYVVQNQAETAARVPCSLCVCVDEWRRA